MPMTRIKGGGSEVEKTYLQSGVAAKGAKVGKTRPKPRQKTVRVTQETLEAERANLIAEKQAQLEAVVDTHDSLVREMFHTEKFLILDYNPEEAKHEDTNYKAKFDLFEKVMPGSSRATRRSRTEQAQLLKAPSVSAPILGPMKKSGKPKGIATISEALVSIKAKGKGRNIDLTSPKRDGNTLNDVASVDVAIHRNLEKANDDEIMKDTPPMKRRKLTKQDIEEPISITIRRSGRFKACTDELDTTPQEALEVSEHHITGVGHDLYLDKYLVQLMNQHIQVPTPLPLSYRENMQESRLAPIATPIALPAKSSIKRVKLLVRRPPPRMTNPRQRPPPTKYNCSINAFLTSYITLDDQDVDEDILQRQSQADADILERAEQVRQSGRYVSEEVTFDFDGDPSLSLTPQRLSTDAWDHVVEAVYHARKFSMKRISGPQIAGQIAKLIRTYWDGQEARKEKRKLQEERRLRALAKTTIRMVTDEWKKAVFHIREQERLKLEAEEVQRGREHLDAILDQSGQLLETQQCDLTRELPRSRSSRMSLTHRGWDSGEEDEEEEEEDTEEEGDAGGQGVDNVDETESPSHDGGSDLERDMPTSDIEDDTNTEMLLDVPGTPTSGHTSLYEGLARTEEYQASSEIEEGVLSDDTSTSGIALLKNTSDVSIPRQRPLILEFEANMATPDSTSPEPPPSPKNSLPIDSSLEGSGPNSRSRAPPDNATPNDHHQDDLQQSSLFPTSSFLPAANLLDVNPRQPLSTAILDPPDEVDANTFPSFESSTEKILSPLLQNQEDDDCSVAPPLTKFSGKGEADGFGQDGPPERESILREQDDIAAYLKPFAVAPVKWISETKIIAPLLLRGVLRPYQQSGLEWLASLHTNNLNGILADEMGLGKTIQTIALLAHLACDRGIWGPHLIIVPTSVLLNWEMEFKKFLPGFRVLSYHGSTKRRKELRQGWNDKHHFNVCITSYTLASRDAHIFKRKSWYYMILDEAHMIKNFKSQRWNILLMFRSFRRLLLTGTPLQNNLTELWALLQFLMSGSNFASLKDFGEWFSNPLEKAIEMGNINDDDTMQRVTKLHTVLRPYLLRRLKRDVEKELPSKFEHLVMCPLSKRQRYLYDEFMARAHTRDALQSGVYQKIANILMQLRKVCNHPDLFEVRPIVTSLAIQKSAIADFEIKELLVRRRLMQDADDTVNLDLLGLRFIDGQNQSMMTALETRRLDATPLLPFISETLGEPPPKDTRTVIGFRKHSAYIQHLNTIAHWKHIGYLNRLRCNTRPIYSSELLDLVRHSHQPLLPASSHHQRPNWEATGILNSMVKSYEMRGEEMASIVDRFAFVTPLVVALDLPRITFSGYEEAPMVEKFISSAAVLHKASVKLQIAFPDPSLLQYDCGKLQELARLLREKKAGGHRVLIFTQMTKILDILEIFLNFHGYLYLRLDGATKIEDRQYITERFNADPRVFCFIASSRSGGVGIK
ncbi:hypothetical protein H0H81_012656 [Sphagnurus paluster]|uniref:DNA helicase n=1 Tax=Sphagnurus paluster TaxID=117069 RepID=A0A9P7FU80_9AGAR|nr:hypothetical protein H0H81_012656 [Sphagnurus paluster]